MSIARKFRNSVLSLALAVAAIGCGSNEVNPNGGGGTNSGPEPKINSYSVTGKAGTFTFIKTDSTLIIWKKEYGATAADDKIVDMKISVSTKAQGDVVNFESALLKPENIQRFSNHLVSLNDYTLGTVINAGEKNIGKTPDGKNVIKAINLSGLDTKILAEGANSLEEFAGVINNPNLKWKLVGDKATGYGGQDKIYSLVVN